MGNKDKGNENKIILEGFPYYPLAHEYCLKENPDAKKTFSKEIVELDFNFFVEFLDVDSPFTSILLEETSYLTLPLIHFLKKRKE